MPVITVGNSQIFDLPHTLVDGSVILDPRFNPGLKALIGSLAIRSEFGVGNQTYFKWGAGDTEWSNIRYPQYNQLHYNVGPIAVPNTALQGNPFVLATIDLGLSSDTIGSDTGFLPVNIDVKAIGIQTNIGGDGGDEDDSFAIDKSRMVVYYPTGGGGPALNLDTAGDTGTQSDKALFAGGLSNDHEMDYDFVVSGATTVDIVGWNGEDIGGPSSGRDMNWWLTWKVSVPGLDV